MVEESTTTRSARVRELLDHPVIDTDGHDVEFVPALLEFLREEGGAGAVEKFTNLPGWYRHDAATRRQLRMVRPPWWALPTRNSVDHATSVLPRLLEERLGELGLDFTVLYPSVGLGVTHLSDPDLRRAACRAVNRYHAEVFGAHGAVMTAAAAIPMHTPDEALEALEHAVSELGMKAVMMAGHVRRPIEADRNSPHGVWIDPLALDSEYDYDPVWVRCQQLRLTPAFHSGGMGWGSRVSINNYMYNHIGHFAAASEALCKALIFGGVTRRFPTMRFLFLEAGVGWAAVLLNDLVGHWEKRHSAAMDNYDPRSLDHDVLAKLFEGYASPVQAPHGGFDDHVAQLWPDVQDRSSLDDFAAIGATSVEELVERFVPSFYFGCEADDRTNAMAFDTRLLPLGSRLNAVFSSDIGHWDVPDMREVLAEAFELVEHDVITESNFRSFVFDNPVKMLTTANPDFFTGTAVEGAVGASRGGATA